MDNGLPILACMSAASLSEHVQFTANEICMFINKTDSCIVFLEASAQIVERHFVGKCDPYIYETMSPKATELD